MSRHEVDAGAAVAIKRVSAAAPNPEAARCALVDEAHFQHLLQGHPGVLAPLGVVMTRDRRLCGVISELAACSLDEFAHVGGWAAPGCIMAILVQLACSLSYVHAMGVVHGHVKPENVLVMADSGADGWPVIKLADFGSAKMVAWLEGRAGSAAASVRFGTPEFMVRDPLLSAPRDVSCFHSVAHFARRRVAHACDGADSSMLPGLCAYAVL